MRKEDIGIVACSAHHQMVTDTRCFVTDRQISFDLVADHLGPARRDLPHTVAFHSQIPKPSAEGIGATHRIYLPCRRLVQPHDTSARTRSYTFVQTGILRLNHLCARRVVHASKSAAAAAAAPHNSRARSACRWYAWLLVNPTRLLSAPIHVRCGEGPALVLTLVPTLVPPAEKLCTW